MVKQFQHKKKKYFPKITNESLLEKMNLEFSRDAEWFKRTNEKLQSVKDDLEKKFYSDEKKLEKLDFIRKLRNKLKDYKDAIKFTEKYKKIRFFERRKLERMLKKVGKEIKNNEGNTEKVNELNTKKNEIVNNINYVKVNIYL
jgi:hypothetical protein